MAPGDTALECLPSGSDGRLCLRKCLVTIPTYLETAIEVALRQKLSARQRAPRLQDPGWEPLRAVLTRRSVPAPLSLAIW